LEQESIMDCYGFCKSEFRCLNPILLISGLIAFRVLINPRFSMGSMENGYLWGYVIMLVSCIK
jgi:hypothetical protein